MKPFILALATALPQYSLDQADIAKKISQVLDLNENHTQFLQKLYCKTQIKRRYSVLKDIQESVENSEFFTKDFLKKIPRTSQRNKIYIKEAPKLALKAAQEAIKNWQQDPKEITHVISVSCTGVMAPGIELILQQELKLLPNAERIGINFMGCFGAFRGLAVASALAKENPNNRILLVCTELCSLHFQVSFQTDVLIGNALFSDGAAAAIIGSKPKNTENAICSIEKTGSFALENTRDKMTWTISDHGCVMSLNKEIPSIIEKNTPTFLKSFLNTDNFNNFSWAIHPGGKSIIEAMEKSCNLTKEQTKSSWNVLNNYGNMSSSTFLFVLEDLLKENKKEKDIIGIGFGPGLSIETILLSKA